MFATGQSPAASRRVDWLPPGEHWQKNAAGWYFSRIKSRRNSPHRRSELHSSTSGFFIATKVTVTLPRSSGGGLAESLPGFRRMGGDRGSLECEFDPARGSLLCGLRSYAVAAPLPSDYRVTRDCESSTATIALIGCGRRKRSHPSPARELYTGTLFQACRDWAETHADAYWIASAKHLIVEPDQVIEPYDLSLRDLDADTRRWRARQIQMHFRSRWIDFCRFKKGPSGFMVAVNRPRVVLLASREYLFGFYEWRERHRDDSFEFEMPLAGLGIGQQMAWLRQQVRTESRQLFLFPDGNDS